MVHQALASHELYWERKPNAAFWKIICWGGGGEGHLYTKFIFKSDYVYVVWQIAYL